MRLLPSWVWLLLAVVFGTTASYLALGWLRNQPRPSPPVTMVVVASQYITPASRLGRDQLKLEPWHQASPPKGAFSRLEEVEGRVTAYSLTPGEIIIAAKLAPIGTTPGLTSLLAPAKRAMTIKVDEASGVAGFLAPENRVDVVVTLDRGEYGKNPVSKVVFQNLKILGIGQKIENRPGDKPLIVPTVTLEVTPQEGERLALAAQEGRISLVLRASSDHKLVETPGTDAVRLFGPLAQAVPQASSVEPTSAPPSSRQAVEVIRGLEREAVNF